MVKPVAILNPGAQRALFRRYHIGGCSGCGFVPDEMLARKFAQQPPLDSHREDVLGLACEL